MTDGVGRDITIRYDSYARPSASRQTCVRDLSALVIEAASLWSLIEERASITPDDRFAVDARDREMTFGEYRESALRTARGLAALGIGPDTTVSWMLPTRFESMVLVAALARLGAIQNPILPIYRTREVGFIANQCEPSLLITTSEWRGFAYAKMAEEIAAEHAGIRTLVVDHELPESDIDRLPPLPELRAADAQPVRWLFYTSGTTSDPKGVQHTDASLWAGAKGMSRAIDLHASDRIAFVFPFTHIGGINWLQAGLAYGCTQILIENFADPGTIPALRRHGVTLATAGTVFHEAYLQFHRAAHLASHRDSNAPPLFPSVRAFPGGGAPKPPQLHYDLKAEMGGAGILSGYGLTEAPILTMASIEDPDPKLAETEGRIALPEVDLRVVRADEEQASAGEEGELRVRAPQLFQGYVDANLNEAAFDAHGYFRTGDLGYLDEEGYLVITGRLKDVIIRKGENIPAKEVENLLYEHPKVADVAVIGLPDPKTGERCCAVVLCRDANNPLEAQEMQAFLRDKNLMVQKIPEQLEIVDSIPRNATGKILKHELRARFSDSTSVAKNRQRP
jgi:cyclohexanecarboxylate-CoA ligase